jgi:hypothetical protein
MKKFMTIAAAALSVLAAAAFTNATTTRTVQHCGTPYRADGTKSLRDIAAYEASSPLTQILADTAWCYTINNSKLTPQYSPYLETYLNTSPDLDNLVPAGTRIWFTVLP